MAHMRQFDTGATRDDLISKPDYEGYLSPLVIERFGRYMLAHQQTPDGPRASDNWQLGIPKDEYIKSLIRHVITLWRSHRGYPTRILPQESLCAILFNANGMLHEYEKDTLSKIPRVPSPVSSRLQPTLASNRARSKKRSRHI